ncbi:MAG TPA: Asp23/Gls24 family envelope stress response protein [Ktedonobacterales bacterium]|nr:Asp23/Gls24 family envelope stress response protein [Ktedonobacterales bacterium]
MQLSETEQTATPRQRRGKIEVSPQAISTIAGRAVSECYGVVGIAGKRLHNGMAELLPAERYQQGIEVQFSNEQIIIDLYVVLEYGLRISEIAHNIMGNVKFAVEKMLGVPVVQVNVNVQGLRVSAPDAR